MLVINNREAPCDILIVGVDEPSPETPAGIAHVEAKSFPTQVYAVLSPTLCATIGSNPK